MKNLIQENIKVVYDPTLECLCVSFHGFISYENLVEGIEYEFEMIRHYRIKKCIVNLEEISVYPTGGQEYIKEVWFPQVIKDGLKIVAFVVSKDVFGAISMQQAHEKADQETDLSIKYFDNDLAASEWIKGQLYII